MSDIKTIENTVGTILEKITEYPKDKILLAYSRFGRPIVSNCEDGLYYWVEFDPSNPLDNFINRFYDKFGNCSSYATDCYKIHFVAYGPNCLMRVDHLLLDWYRFEVKEILRADSLFTIPSKNEGPVRFTENLNGQWFLRCDAAVSVYAPHEGMNKVGVYEHLGPVVLTSGDIEIIKGE